MDLELLKLLFPEGILDYFNIVKYTEISGKLHFYLEEKNILPEQYNSEPSQSKGFMGEMIIEDFPLRGKEVLLHIKRRRWTLKQSG